MDAASQWFGPLGNWSVIDCRSCEEMPPTYVAKSCCESHQTYMAGSSHEAARIQGFDARQRRLRITDVWQCYGDPGKV